MLYDNFAVNLVTVLSRIFPIYFVNGKQMRISPIIIVIQGKWYGLFGIDSTQSFCSLIVQRKITVRSNVRMYQISKIILDSCFFIHNHVTIPDAPIPNIKCKKNINGLYVGNQT
jgi:hypothetical protein